MTAIILAGGKSSRFGSDKAFIKINGMPLIKKQLQLLRSIFKKIIIVTNNPEKYKLVITEKPILNADIRGLHADTRRFYRLRHPRLSACNLRESALNNTFSALTKLRGVKIVSDIIPNRGPLGGIYSGLMHSDSFYNFVFACDMPHLNLKLIKYMLKARNGFDVVAPHLEKGYETLFAIYSKNCIIPIYKTILSKKLRIRDFFKKVMVKEIKEEEVKRFGKPNILFMNVNTLSDYTMLYTANLKN